ncbi:MAG: cobalt/nickel transport system permease protein [Clostridiales bacterium]|nr:cobalt/nickel transport system permease protein [Clostridiales bacterium]MDK2933703.1 cobalt/nickel transport system permease protein [Clostridiales bacterium]
MSKTNVIPQWLLESDVSDFQVSRAKVNKNRKSFIEKTLAQLSDTIQNEFLSEIYAKKDGLLQKLDPRVKFVSFVLWIGFATLTGNITVLVVMYLSTLLLLFLSKLPILKFLKRIWVFMPVFTALMVLPAVFNFIVPGEPLWVIYQFKQPTHLFGLQLPELLAVTRQGVKAGVMLILRVSISVSLGLILTVTTPWARLMKSLHLIKIPGIFITMLDMAYRYIAVFVNRSLEMFEARKTRTIGQLTYSSNKQFVSNAIGALFLKSMHFSENVYMAMMSRGYTGQVETLYPFKLSKLDFGWICSIILFMTLLYIVS